MSVARRTAYAVLLVFGAVACASSLRPAVAGGAGPPAATGPAAPSTAPAATTAPTTAPSLLALPPGAARLDVPLARADALLLARVRINGQDAGWFVVDTGASFCTIDREVAGRLKLRPIARTQAASAAGQGVGMEVVELPRLDLGGGGGAPSATFGPVAAGSADFKGISAVIGVPLGGVIGNDLLRELPFTLDTRAATLTFYDRDRFDAGSAGAFKPAGPPVPLRVRAQAPPTVPASVEGRGGQAVIDTGKNGTFTLHANFRRLFPELVEGKHLVGTTTSSLSGISRERVGTFDTLDALGRTWRQTCGHVASIGGAAAGFDAQEATTLGVIGMGRLGDARLTFDYANRRAWAEWLDAEPADAMVRRLTTAAVAPQPGGGAVVAGHDLTDVTPLMAAAIVGRLDVVNALLTAGADPSAEDRGGNTALHFAAAHADVAAALLAKGAKPNGRTGLGGYTPLALAVQGGDADVARVLLAGGADPNLPDVSGATPLHRAAEGDYTELVRLLLANRAAVDARDKDRVTPLIYAAVNGGGVAVVAALLDAGAAVDATDAQGATPLMVAAAKGRPGVARALLDRGARVNVSADNGITPLIAAADEGDADTVAVLLARGADPTARTVQGRTALNYAASSGKLDIVRLLALGGGGGGGTPTTAPTAGAAPTPRAP